MFNPANVHVACHKLPPSYIEIYNVFSVSNDNAPIKVLFDGGMCERMNLCTVLLLAPPERVSELRLEPSILALAQPKGCGPEAREAEKKNVLNAGRVEYGIVAHYAYVFMFPMSKTQIS